MSFITSFWISNFFALSSTILFPRCHFLLHHPIWPCLPKLLASVGTVFAPRRRCAFARSSTCCATNPRASHTLCLQNSSALGRHSFPNNYNTAELFRFSALSPPLVVVYNVVLADSPSGTSDTTAWSSVQGRYSRSTVEVLHNNAVCCLSPLSFWSLGLHHSMVPEVFNTTSVVVVRGLTSCVAAARWPSTQNNLSVCLVHAGVPTSLNSTMVSLGPFRESLPAGSRCRTPLPRGFC